MPRGAAEAAGERPTGNSGGRRRGVGRLGAERAEERSRRVGLGRDLPYEFVFLLPNRATDPSCRNWPNPSAIRLPGIRIRFTDPVVNEEVGKDLVTRIFFNI